MKLRKPLKKPVMPKTEATETTEAADVAASTPVSTATPARDESTCEAPSDNSCKSTESGSTPSTSTPSTRDEYHNAASDPSNVSNFQKEAPSWRYSDKRRDPSKSEFRDRKPDSPQNPSSKKYTDAEKRSIWLETYTKEFQRQVPLCEKAEQTQGASAHKEAARRASACADSAVAFLEELEDLVKKAEVAHVSDLSRLVGPAELIQAPLPGWSRLAGLDYVDEVSAALSDLTASYNKNIAELKQEFEKRFKALETRKQLSGSKRAKRNRAKS